MAVTPMDAAVEAQQQGEDDAEQRTVPFPAISDGDGNPINLPIREMKDGQVIGLMNLHSRMQRKTYTTGEQAKMFSKFSQLIVSLVDDESLREQIEIGMLVGEVSADDLTDLWSTIVEEDAGRPTGSPTASSSQRKASGPTSRGKSQRRASPSKRSPSTGSAT